MTVRIDACLLFTTESALLYFSVLMCQTFLKIRLNNLVFVSDWETYCVPFSQILKYQKEFKFEGYFCLKNNCGYKFCFVVQ